MRNSLKQYRCRSCGAVDDILPPRWCCKCGGLLDLHFTPSFPVTRFSGRERTMWRYREALPIDGDDSVVSMSEGYTPLISAEIGGRKVLLKNDTLFPTGSFKDRGASVLMSMLKEVGVKSIVEDSSGNAGAAISAYAARAGIPCEIYVPESAPVAKLRQISAYGSSVHHIYGSREDVAQAALGASEQSFYASHVWQPFFLHGTKTVAYEIVEQLGWKAPDTVVIPVGNGSLLLGLSLGFRDLIEAGVIRAMPALIGVQAAGCSPLVDLFRGHGTVSEKAQFPTIADGIAVANPLRGRQIIDAVRDSRGMILQVEDYEITAMYKELAVMGLYVELTSAAGVAGLKKIVNDLRESEVIVTVLTGHGLKSS